MSTFFKPRARFFRMNLINQTLPPWRPGFEGAHGELMDPAKIAPTFPTIRSISPGYHGRESSKLVIQFQDHDAPVFGPE